MTPPSGWSNRMRIPRSVCRFGTKGKPGNTNWVMMGKGIKNWEKTEHKGMWLREGSTEAVPVLQKHTVITEHVFHEAWILISWRRKKIIGSVWFRCTVVPKGEFWIIISPQNEHWLGVRGVQIASERFVLKLFLEFQTPTWKYIFVYRKDTWEH